MNDSNDDVTQDQRLVEEATTALTRAARLGVDFGEVLCRIVTTVAADVGGVDTLLATRPASWEADYVRQIVHSTAGTDESSLDQWRSEAIALPFDCEDIFHGFGFEDLRNTALMSLAKRQDRAAEALLGEFALPEEQKKLREVHEEMPRLEDEGGDIEERRSALVDIAQRIWDSAHLRAKEAGSPLIEDYAWLVRAQKQVEDLYAADQAFYQSAYLAAARHAIVQRGLPNRVVIADTSTPTDQDDYLALIHRCE